MKSCASNAERGGDSGVVNARRDGGERREGERTTSYPPSTANRDRADTHDTYDSSSQRLCCNSDLGELNLISVRSVVSASASVARKTAAAASSRKDNRRAVAVRSRGGSSSRSLMDGRGDDNNDDEAAVPLPPHVTVKDDNNGTASHSGMVQTMDVTSFVVNNRALIMTFLKVS